MTRNVPNLSRAAAARFKPRTVTTASGRTVTVSPELIQDRLSRTRTAALRDGGKADSARMQQQAADARLAALGAIFLSSRGNWMGSPEDHQALGAWVASLPDSVLPLDQVAELLASARGSKLLDSMGGAK